MSSSRPTRKSDHRRALRDWSRRIEITSFTHPKAVPTLRDADEVAQRIERHDDVTYRALVPNAVGMERAIDAGVDKVNALVTVSETYSEHNQNMTVERS